MFREMVHWNSLQHLKICEAKKETNSLRALYRGEKTSGNNPTQNSRRNVNHWIYMPSLDMGDKTPHVAINDASQVSKRQ